MKITSKPVRVGKQRLIGEVELLDKIGVVENTDKAIFNYKRSPGDANVAIIAAAAYAIKQKEDMLVLLGNSYMNRVYHVKAVSDMVDGLRDMFAANGVKNKIYYVKQNKEVYKAYATLNKEDLKESRIMTFKEFLAEETFKTSITSFSGRTLGIDILKNPKNFHELVTFIGSDKDDMIGGFQDKNNDLYFWNSAGVLHDNIEKNLKVNVDKKNRFRLDITDSLNHIVFIPAEGSSNAASISKIDKLKKVLGKRNLYVVKTAYDNSLYINGKKASKTEVDEFIKITKYKNVN